MFEPAGLLASEGALIAGRFQAGRAIAVGTKATVFAGRHVGLDEAVAIKVLHPNLANPRFTANFIREARNASRIKSEHVPRYIDVGELENGLPFVVMEYLEGGTLRNVTARKSELDVADAVDYVLQACEALAAAHSVGILHRDLKPSNLFVTTRLDGAPHVKVLDFGTSRAFNSEGVREDEGLTVAHLAPGSQKYHAPEQFGPEEPDARCDIWALGAVLYTLLTLRPPFSSHAPGETMKKILESAPEPPRRIRPSLPQGLEEIVLRCLEKQRDARPSRVADLAIALGPHAPKRSVALVAQIVEIQGRARGAVVRDEAALPIARISEGTWNTPLRRSKGVVAARSIRSRWSSVALTASAILAIVVFVFVMGRTTADRHATRTAAPSMPTAVATAPPTVAATTTVQPSPPPTVVAMPSSSAPLVAPAVSRSAPPRTTRFVSRTARPAPPPPPAGSIPAEGPGGDPWGWQR